MIDDHFVILGALIGVLGSLRYALATVRGATAPNRVTWFFWAAAPLIGFFAQLDQGIGLQSLMTLSVGLGPAIVFTASFVNARAYWRPTRFDIACALVSVVAIVLWQTLDSPTLAVLLAVLADLVAGLPTVVKAYRTPETEHPSVYLNSAINAGITLLTIDHWNVATWAFPVYIAVLSSGVFTLVAIRPRLRPA